MARHIALPECVVLGVRRAAGVLLALCLATEVTAAPGVKVLSDRILTGHGIGEFVPRFVTYLPSSLSVPAGTTETLAPDATYDAIEVAGTLRCPAPFRLNVTHIVVLPGGTFDCRAPGVIVFRDVPIDTAKDPYQLGNGLIVMGRLLLGTGTKTLMAELTTEARAGASTLELDVPVDWEVGDELLLPDMRQVKSSSSPADRVLGRREAPVFLAGKTGTTITLSKPLDFEHAAVRDPDGNVVLRPRVANLSRPLVIRSQNARGARGHVIVMGHDARWEVRGVSFEDLGRTTADRLDSAAADDRGVITKVGTNQIGRYAFHVHHAHGTGSVFAASVVRDQGLVKAGHATHSTEGTLIENSIAVGFVGSGFITEDGPERRNIFRRNIAAYIAGTGIGGKDAVERDAPFAEGAGFWIRGMENTWEDNEAWNSHIGFQFMYRRQVASQQFDVKEAVPVAFTGNIALGNYFSGLETWGAPHALLGDGIHLLHNGTQIHTGSAEAGNLWVKNLHVTCSDGERWAIESSQAYIGRLTIEGGSIRGCGVGVQDADMLTLRNVTLQNVINIDQRHAYSGIGQWENVVHLPLKNHPPQYVLFRVFDWQPGQPLPRWNTVWQWTPVRGSRYRIINWQGTGENYLLYRTEQMRNKPAYPALPGYGQWFYAPEEGLTLGETWDRWGIALGGGVIAESEAIELEGLVNGVAKQGEDTPLGPPRAVLNIPNRVEPAVIDQGKVHFWFTASGHATDASYSVRFRVNDGTELHANPSEAGFEKGSHYPFPATKLADGVNTVTTWREKPNGKKIPGSELTFTFVVERNAQPTTTAAAQPD